MSSVYPPIQSINIFEERLFRASGQAGGGAPSSLPASSPDTLVCNSWHHLWLNIRLYPPKSPLRDAFPAQNTILSAQKLPAECFSGSKYNFIRPKGPCGTLFRLKLQFCPPEKPLRDAFPAQNTILSAHKAPAGRLSVIPKMKYMTLGSKF